MSTKGQKRREQLGAVAAKRDGWQSERDEDQDAPELPEPDGDEQYRPEGEQIWK